MSSKLTGTVAASTSVVALAIPELHATAYHLEWLKAWRIFAGRHGSLD